MPFMIKPPPIIGQQQTDTLHVTSRSEQRKTMQAKEPSGSLKILLFQFVLFVGCAIGGGILCWCGSTQANPGVFFVSIAMLAVAAATLFWLVPNFKAWKRRK